MGFKLRDLITLKEESIEIEKQAADPLEGRIQKYLKQEGLDGFEEISARDIALELHNKGYADLDEVCNFFSVGSIEESKNRIAYYLRKTHNDLGRDNFPLNASLGLILIWDKFYREVKSRENLFCERVEREFLEGKELIDELDSRINGLKNNFKGRAYFALGNLGRNKCVGAFADAARGSFLFGGFSKQYDDAKRGKLDAEARQVERECTSSETLEDYFYPLRTDLAYTLSDVIQKISPTRFGPFKNRDVTKLLRRRAVELRRDVREVYKDPDAVSYISADIYRYTLLLKDEDPEKLSLLEEGLGHMREHLRVNPDSRERFKLGAYLQDIFVVKYLQKKEIDFGLLRESYDEYLFNIEGFEDDHYEGDFQLLMHIVKNQFAGLNSFFIHALSADDLKNVFSYCREQNMSFKRLYGRFSSTALNSAPEKYKSQYERMLGFKGI